MRDSLLLYFEDSRAGNPQPKREKPHEKDDDLGGVRTGEPFDRKSKCLTFKLEGQFAESAKLERAIRANLRGLG
jgi:hypothetical protein